jgi:hypothetical protein
MGGVYKHKDLTGDKVHSPFSFIYTNEEERLSAIFNDNDLYKLAIQENNGDPSFWVLTGIDPNIWQKLGE